MMCHFILFTVVEGSPNAQCVSFEVILSPRVENAKIPQLTPKRTGIVTRQAFDEKLETAERRRKVKNNYPTFNLLYLIN